MQTTEARELDSGAEVFVLDGVGNKNPLHVGIFVSGPHEDGGTGFRRKWVALVRKGGDLALYNLSDLAVKPPAPVEGDTWSKRLEGTRRYVDGVTDRYVVLKGDAGKPASKAYVVPLDTFLATYRKVV